MSELPLHILIVNGSLSSTSVTRTVLQHVAERFQEGGATVDALDFEKEPLPLFSPDTAYSGSGYAGLKVRVDKADVFLLGTPDYHGSISSVLKNFLDHFWTEFSGKLFATIVASNEKGLTVTDQLRTVARQCYAWSLPYGVSFADGQDVKDGRITGAGFKNRIEMFVRDVRVYGALIAQQRRADLTATEPGFMARHRQ